MEDTAPAAPIPAAGLRVAVVALVIALVAALAYIVHLHDRLAQLEQRAPIAKREAPAAPAPAARPAAPAAAGAENAAVPNEDAIQAALTAPQRQALVDGLKAQGGPDRIAAFYVQQNNPETAAVQLALQRIFEQAGWTTETVRTGYPLKTGIFLLAADETPPPFVDAVNDAFDAAGIDVQYLTGYRSFVTERKRANANWRGPELTDAQAFTIVIGSRPTPKAAGASSEM
jgi:hypothetical protein